VKSAAGTLAVSRALSAAMAAISDLSPESRRAGDGPEAVGLLWRKLPDSNAPQNAASRRSRGHVHAHVRFSIFLLSKSLGKARISSDSTSPIISSTTS